MQVASLNRVVGALAEPTIADARPRRCRDRQKTSGMRHAGSVLSTGAIAAVVGKISRMYESNGCDGPTGYSGFNGFSGSLSRDCVVAVSKPSDSRIAI